MSPEVGAVLQYGALGLLLLVLVGIFLLIRQFAPRTIDALTGLTTTLGGLSAKIDGFADQLNTHTHGAREDGTTTGNRPVVVPAEQRRGLNGA